MTETPSPVPETSLASMVQRIAGLLEHGGGVLSTGDVADLRRMEPRRIASPAFYKLVGAVLDPELPPEGARREEVETRWAAAIVGLAHLSGLHRQGTHLGSALVEAEFSEIRFVRLLRADVERLIDDVPQLGRFLAAKQTPADFTDAVRLLLSAGRSDEETVRRRLARDYYAALKHSESK